MIESLGRCKQNLIRFSAKSLEDQKTEKNMDRKILIHEFYKGKKDCSIGNLHHILAKGLAVFTHVLKFRVKLNFRVIV